MSFVSSSTLVFLASLIWMPMCFIINFMSTNLKEYINEWHVLFAVIGSFLFLLLFIRFMKDKSETTSQPLFYFFATCSFISVTNLLIGLENDDFIAGFIRFYTRRGELYLKTAHGTLTCYWDGVIHYGMCLTMLAAISWGQSYRDVGFLWVGSMLNSLLVSICGLILGRCHVQLLLLIKLIVLMVVIFAICKFLSQSQSQSNTPTKNVTKISSSIANRPLDILIVFLCLVAILIHIIRGATALPCDKTLQFMKLYVNHVEPYLNDTVVFPKLQMLIYLFYVVPFLCCAIYCLFMPGRYSVFSWGLVMSGAVMQGQFVHTFASIHMRTPYIYRLQTHDQYFWLFWLVNGLVLLPHLLLIYRSQENQHYFCCVESELAWCELSPRQQRKPKISSIHNPYLRSNSLEKKSS